MLTRCGVWGSPIGHSLSPALHRAAYTALGLDSWTYDRREVDENGFSDALAGLDDSWRGLSLTMPLKEAALAAARVVDPVAGETGAANTLVRQADGWHAYNTDVQGIVLALREAGCVAPLSALVVGSGATARSAVAALSELGVSAVTFLVRGEARPETVAQARRAGLEVDVATLTDWRPADVVVSTVPPQAVAGLEHFPAAHAPATGDAAAPTDAAEPAAGPAATTHLEPQASRVGASVVLDVVYGGGRTSLQRAAQAAGWAVPDGVRMLLHQATAQVELMTGLPAPVAAMDRALSAALEARRREAEASRG